MSFVLNKVLLTKKTIFFPKSLEMTSKHIRTQSTQSCMKVVKKIYETHMCVHMCILCVWNTFLYMKIVWKLYETSLWIFIQFSCMKTCSKHIVCTYMSFISISKMFHYGLFQSFNNISNERKFTFSALWYLLTNFIAVKVIYFVPFPLSRIGNGNVTQ